MFVCMFLYVYMYAYSYGTLRARIEKTRNTMLIFYIGDQLLPQFLTFQIVASPLATTSLDPSFRDLHNIVKIFEFKGQS